MWGCLTVCLSVGYDLAVWLAQIITFVGEMKTAGREARGRDAKGDRVWGGVSPYPGGRAWEGGCAPVPRIFRQPDSVATALSFTVEFFLSLFLPDDGSQHPRRGQPANVYQRFGHRCNYYQWPRYLVNPFPNFYRGSKSVIFGLMLNNARLSAAVVWKPSKISSPFLNLVCDDYLTMSPLPTKFCADRYTRLINHLC